MAEEEVVSVVCARLVFGCDDALRVFRCDVPLDDALSRTIRGNTAICR